MDNCCPNTESGAEHSDGSHEETLGQAVRLSRNTLISDQEGGIKDHEPGAHLDSQNCKLLLRAKGQHANLVECHHELLRHQLRVLEDQATADGLQCSFEIILAEAVLAKNCLIRSCV